MTWRALCISLLSWVAAGAGAGAADPTAAATGEVLRLAAAVEATTTHPLAAAVAAAAAERDAGGGGLPRADDAETSPGRGAAATVEGRRVFVGRVCWIVLATLQIKGTLVH